MRRAAFIVAVSLLASSETCYAGPHALSPAFREKAMRVCTEDAMRLCASYLSDEGHLARCMEANRRQLTPSCRAVVN